MGLPGGGAMNVRESFEKQMLVYQIELPKIILTKG